MHILTKTTKTQGQTNQKRNAECFPSAAKVQLENGKIVTMSQLRIGDRVQTGIYDIRLLFQNLLFQNKYLL